MQEAGNDPAQHPGFLAVRSVLVPDTAPFTPILASVSLPAAIPQMPRHCCSPPTDGTLTIPLPLLVAWLHSMQGVALFLLGAL